MGLFVLVRCEVEIFVCSKLDWHRQTRDQYLSD